MQQNKDNLTINLTVPTGWDKLDDHQLRYVFGLLAQGFPSPQVKTYCLFRWTGMQVMHKYGKGWLLKFYGINQLSRIFPFLRKVCAQRNIGHRDR